MTQDPHAPRVEADWLLAAEPVALLRILDRQQVYLLPSTPRKFRLLCCAFIRSAWDRISDSRITLACLAAELTAAGRASVLDLRESRDMAAHARMGNRLVSFDGAAAQLGELACGPREAFGYEDFWRVTLLAGSIGIDLPEQAATLRCLFYNPFRAADDVFAALRNSPGAAAIGLARQYAIERRFADMPFVASQLVAAGADEATERIRHLRGQQRCGACLGAGKAIMPKGMLSDAPCPHCAGSGWLALPVFHVGGCWAIDTLLGF